MATSFNYDQAIRVATTVRDAAPNDDFRVSLEFLIEQFEAAKEDVEISDPDFLAKVMEQLQQQHGIDPFRDILEDPAKASTNSLLPTLDPPKQQPPQPPQPTPAPQPSPPTPAQLTPLAPSSSSSAATATAAQCVLPFPFCKERQCFLVPPHALQLFVAAWTWLQHQQQQQLVLQQQRQQQRQHPRPAGRGPGFQANPRGPSQ